MYKIKLNFFYYIKKVKFIFLAQNGVKNETPPRSMKLWIMKNNIYESKFHRTKICVSGRIDPEFSDPQFSDLEFSDLEFSDPEFSDPEFSHP